MIDNNTSTELEQMRQQMSALKDKLAKQDIVNERLMSESMKSKMSWINRFVIFEVLMIPLIGVLLLPMMSSMNMSWWIYATVMLCIIADVVIDYFVNVRALKDEDYHHNNMIETIKKLMAMKRLRFIQMCVSIPMILVVVMWAFWDANGNDKTCFLHENGIIWCIVGIIIGLCIGFAIYTKMQKTNNNIIKQMQDLLNENDD